MKDDSPTAQVGSTPVYFCCRSCSGYFETNRAKVLAARGIADVTSAASTG